ncbi:Uma2 family endonuclease [Siccirubricoccus phaeus]|uniref:Uma2 family endonuclease n=1 Tax=Siccirubricoccus phaeus TaxID=2595053 RepID=UPI0011F323B4|nr:Uma2 family endonuclease [Siccirubricoccus phaeus]
MNIAPRRPMGLAEFLAWEERQEQKWEYDGFAPVATVGVTVAQAVIRRNLTTALHTRLRGTPCRFYGPELKVQVAGSIRYPDGFVACSPAAANDRVIHDPVVLFEILSPSTQAMDRIVKAREYRDTPSAMRYVMLEQDRPAATIHAREGDRWVVSILVAGETLELPELGLSLPLDELYEDVPFEASPDEADAEA